MITEKFCVYKITNLVSGTLYIGKTNNMIDRFKSHITAANSGNNNQIICKAIAKYGSNNFSIELIDDNLSEDMAFLLEISWINLLKSTGNRLYNMTIGGEGRSGLKHSEETKKKMSESQKGKIVSEETKAKQSIAHLGDKTFNFGKQLPESTRNKISQSNLGKKTKLSKSLINQITLLISNGDTAKSISNQLNLCEKTVRKISRNKITINGERNPNAQLKGHQVVEIKLLLNSGNTIANIARQYNVGESTIRHIRDGKTWKHIQ